MMVAPVWQHKLIKISNSNQRFLIKFACCNSILACAANLISTMTNNWLYTAEVLKYYIHPNWTTGYDDQINQPVYFKNATFGPWLFCWLDPVTEFHCNKVDYFQDEEPSDATSSIHQSVKKASIFMLIGTVLNILGAINITLCCFKEHPFRSLMGSSLFHIFSGMGIFACIIVYMSAVSKEVGNKQYAATEVDDPLFHYSYGYSFILLKVSFLGNEAAALFSVLVYMAKRDERTYNEYHIKAFASNSIPEFQNIKRIIETNRRSRFRSNERSSRKSLVTDADDEKPELFHLKIEPENDSHIFIR